MIGRTDLAGEVRVGLVKEVMWVNIWRGSQGNYKEENKGGRGGERRDFFFLAMPRSMHDPHWPGIEPVPPAVEARSLNHWTAREVPGETLLTEENVESVRPAPLSGEDESRGWRERQDHTFRL